VIVCGRVLAEGTACGEPVAEEGQACPAHRRAEATALAAQARAARRAQPSAEAAPPPLADDDAAAMFTTLDRHGVAYVVIGGMAAAMWGADLPRTTDADIVPAADPANLERLAAALAELGARLRVPGEPDGLPAPLDATMLAGLTTVTMLTDHGPLDVTFRPDGTTGYADLAARSVRRPVGDHPGVPVADLADVIASKQAAGRAKDLTALPALRRLRTQP
jgi:hypothetical protein